MPRLQLQSPERAALADAHQQRAQAQATLAEAEAAHAATERDYNGARYRVSELEARIRELRARPTQNNQGILADINDKLSHSYEALKAAKIAAQPFGVEAEQTQARVTAASFAPPVLQIRVTEAAAVVIRAEAAPVATAALARLQEAFDIILQHGPDLLYLIDRQLVPAEIAAAVGKAAGGLLPRCRPAWVEFETRYRQSPWEAARAALEQDPDAALPR